MIVVTDSGDWIGVVPDLNSSRDSAERRVCKFLLNLLGEEIGLRVLGLKVYEERRRLDVRRDVDDFLQTRNTERHGNVLTRDTGIVERIQRHLGGGLSNGLGGEGSTHLSGVNERLVELRLDFT